MQLFGRKPAWQVAGNTEKRGTDGQAMILHRETRSRSEIRNERGNLWILLVGDRNPFFSIKPKEANQLVLTEDVSTFHRNRCFTLALQHWNTACRRYREGRNSHVIKPVTSAIAWLPCQQTLYQGCSIAKVSQLALIILPINLDHEDKCYISALQTETWTWWWFSLPWGSFICNVLFEVLHRGRGAPVPFNAT